MAAKSRNAFVYNPLPSKTCVRLIDLDQTVSGEISFALYAFELDNAPPFDALSYTWGDASCPYLPSTKLRLQIPKVVCCNGASLQVQPNLFAALEELQTAKISRTRYIWIDAICIDQQNLSERSSQVQMMGALYEQANSVIVWVGPEDETVEDAFIVLERLGSVGRVPRSKQQLEEVKAALRHITVSDFYDPACYPAKLGFEPFNDRQWLSVAAFLHRPYFKRVWVIQEIHRAKKIILVCGKWLFDWSVFSAALMFLLATNWHTAIHTEVLNLKVTDPKARIDFEDLLAAIDTGGIAAMQLVKSSEYARGDFGLFSLEDLLSTHRSCLATDPRDKIYSLLGITNLNKPPFTDLLKAQCLAVDYQLSVETLYTRVVRVLFESRGDLQRLRHRESNRERSLKNLPSWVPDLSVSLVPDLLPGKWCANGDWAWTMDGCKYDDEELGVQGHFLGVIEACSIPPFTLQTLIWGSIAEVARGIPGYYKPFHHCTSNQAETRIEVLAKTCIADTLRSQTPASPELLCNYFIRKVAMLCAVGYKWYGEKSHPKASQMAGKIHRFMLSKFDFSMNEARVTPWIRLFKEEPESSTYNCIVLSQNVERLTEEGFATSADFERQVDAVTGYRVFFRTKNKLLGVGPVDLRKGDEVWVIAGLSEPAILRPKPGKPQGIKTREFIGVGYVHGIMHGEAMNLGLPKENIILR